MWTSGITLISLLVGQILPAPITSKPLEDSTSLQKQSSNAGAKDLETQDLYNDSDTRSHTNLTRIVRNFDDPFMEYPNQDDYADEFFNPSENEQEYSGLNTPPIHEGPNGFVNSAIERGNHQNVVEFNGGNSGAEFGSDQRSNLECGDFIDGPNADIRPVGCQRPIDEPGDPNLGMQAFQMYPPNQPPIMIPMQYGYPPMPMLPQSNSYPGYPLQQLPMHPGYGSQMIFLREPNQNNQKNIPTYYTTPSLQEFTNSSSAIDPRLVGTGHFHSHTFTHTHMKGHQRPVLNIVPNQPMVRPNINLHVIQNQNSAIQPQYTHTVPLQPGLRTDADHSKQRQVPNLFTNVETNKHALRPTASISTDSNATETFRQDSNYHLIPPTAMYQSQGFYQDRRGYMPVMGGNQEDFRLDPPSQANEKLGRFPMEKLEMSPLPTLPQNLFELGPEEQKNAMQDYFVREQNNIRDYLDRIEENNRRNMQILSEMLRANPTRSSNLQDFENNLNIESEVSGGSQYLDNEMDNMMQSELGDYQGNQEKINSNLGHIINIPYKYNSESDWLTRFSRSLNKTSTEQLDKLLLIEKEVIDHLKKDAKDDEDLMMIGYIGDNIINDLEKKENETKRTKREIGGTGYRVPLNSFFVDPRAKLDVPKTLDNLGAVAKDTFEHERAPLYHVRNIMGSAQDAVMATIKIPTKNFLIPTQYEIVNAGQRDVVANYPQAENYQQIPDTFQRVGSMIRSSVQSGQEAISHVGEVANHAKNAIHSTRFVAPRLLSHGVPVVTKKPRKLTLIAPRILGITNDDVVGVRENPQTEYVGVGNIFEAVGISKPNSDVKFEKIIMTPKYKSVPSKQFQNFVGVKIEDYNVKEEEKQLVETMKTLGEMKDTMGVGNMKDLFTKVKRNLRQIPTLEMTETEYHPEQEPEDIINMPNEKNQWDENQARIERPFSNEHYLGPILGAINPVMYEKLFNESIVSKNEPDTVFHHRDMWKRDTTEPNKEVGNVGTSMKLTEPMLKPFMGKVKMNDDVPQKYVLDLDNVEDEEWKKDETQGLENGGDLEYEE